jgi:hypothetical protein
LQGDPQGRHLARQILRVRQIALRLDAVPVRGDPALS